MKPTETGSGDDETGQTAESAPIPAFGPDLNRALCLLLGREQYPGLNGYLREAHGGRWCVPWDDYSGSDTAAFRLIVELQRKAGRVTLQHLGGVGYCCSITVFYDGDVIAEVSEEDKEVREALCRAAWLALTERRRKGVGE